MDVVQFQEKLRDICELGKQNGNMLTHEQIREHFASTDLETSQMLKVILHDRYIYRKKGFQRLDYSK